MIEVCRESASNAIRHGGAGEVVISMTDEGGRVQVRVRDDGTGVDPRAVAGLGTSMLDDTCVTWGLGDVAGGGAELVATLV
jgi:anti-sigma regulatory factor (Ser/Thr protein kinase)